MTEIQHTKVTSLLAQGAHQSPKSFSLFIPFSTYRMDSLDIIGTITAIENELDIKIPDADLEKFTCGNEVIEYLEAVL